MKVSHCMKIDLSEQIDLALLSYNHVDEFALEQQVDPANEPSDVGLNLPLDLLRSPNHSVVVYAKDDSLSLQGINEGDLLIVDQRLKPKDQDVLLVNLDGELSCRLLDEKQSALLIDDTSQAPIQLNEHANLFVEGVVLQVVKSLR